MLPYQGVTVGIQPHSAPVHSSYFHEQDKYGQYVYGYASGLHAKDEMKTADGVTRGGYSYIDANGILQTVQYISDPIHGFRVTATNIPRDLPEVALAKAQHYHAYQNIKAEHAYIAAVQRANSPVALSPLPPQNSIVVPVSAANIAPIPETKIAPIPYVPQSVHYIPIPVSSQYHEQDKLGQYTYGYTEPLGSKSESKTADGITRGGYSYIDANGILQSVQYISDPVNGFRVQATNLPEAPVVTLVGPKVTTSVVGPKDQNTIVSSGINAVPINPIVVQDNIPIATSEIHAVPAHPQAGFPVLSPEYHGYQPIPSGNRYVNPVILSDTNAYISERGDQPILTNPPVLTEAEYSIHSNRNNPILTQPPALTNPIHTIPFPSNGRIVTHDNVLANTHTESITNLNIQQPVNNPNISPEIVYQEQYIPNADPNYGNIPPQALLPPSSHQILNPGNPQLSYEALNPQPVLNQPAGQFNLQAQQIQDIQQPINSGQINVKPQLFSPLNQPVNIPSGPNNHLINNASPNYQIPINPRPNVGSEAISKDLINSGVINQQGGGIYGGQGAFLRGNEQPYGSITGEGSPALFASSQGHVQQVSQTPVNAVRPQQQASYERGDSAAPSNERIVGSGYEIQGPTGNPNVQVSGYYTSDIEY